MLENYRRLTKHDSCYYDEMEDLDVEVLYARLSDLEDQIEARKVIELPCSLGEHFVIQDCGFGRFHVEKALIVGYNFAGDSTIFPVDSYDNWYLPSRVFDTKEEANREKEMLENM